MKTIKIFSVPSHQQVDRTSGVDMARIIQPSKFLNGYKDKDVKFIVDVYDPVKNKTLDWLEVAHKYDIVYFNYTALPWEFAKMGLMVRKFNKLMVLDLDDSLWDIMPDNPAYEAMKKGSEYIKNITSICNEVDYITTTSKYLRNVIAHNTNKPTSKIAVFPNYIDLDTLYTHRSPFKDTREIRLLAFGSTTHFIDLQDEEFEKGIDMVMKNYPNVVFKTVGALIPKYKHKWGRRYENDYGHQDIYKWIKERFPDFMDETDILVTPLAINRYTMCKSGIKFWEGSSAVKVGCWQDMRQYQELVKNGENGFLCRTADDWYGSIKYLIEHPKERKKMGEEAFRTTEDCGQIKNHVSDYSSFFKTILDI